MAGAAGGAGGAAGWLGRCSLPCRCWVGGVAGAVAALVGTGMAGRLSRSGGISGGGIGGWPLISNGPLALFSSVAQPPLPSVAPMLHATSWLPADQLGKEMVL